MRVLIAIRTCLFHYKTIIIHYEWYGTLLYILGYYTTATKAAKFSQLCCYPDIYDEFIGNKMPQLKTGFGDVGDQREECKFE